MMHWDFPMKQKNDLSIDEVCRILSISTATCRNWIRLKKLIPSYKIGKNYYFTENYIHAFRAELVSGESPSLKSRRNKQFISGNFLYRSYVSDTCQNIAPLQHVLTQLREEPPALLPDLIPCLIADCALHLFAGKQHLSYSAGTPLLAQFLNGTFSLPHYAPLIDTLIADRAQALSFCETTPHLFCPDYRYEPGEDFLGLLYLSCQSMGRRKAAGSYYTPVKIVRKAIGSLDFSACGDILDPCCGTGNFLLQLPASVPLEQIYGTDTDPAAIRIARINLALKYDGISVSQLCGHLTEQNFLTGCPDRTFRYIIGNPPWGSAFSAEEQQTLQQLSCQTAHGKKPESSAVFCECALSHLTHDGELVFILPESLLHVRSHTRLRQIFLESGSIRYLEYLGNVFDGVQCPSILLHFIRTGKPFSTAGMTVKNAARIHTITTARSVSPESFCFLASDEEYQILQKIKHHEPACFLADHADFALGIVTGNNRKYLSSEQTPENEPVLRGSDLFLYGYRQPEHYLAFSPDQFQQTAPERFYRAPEKLLYRFISNQLVFAYDNRQMLSLNSCNLVIPRLEGIPVRYVLAVLNSSAAQFLFQLEFHSVKVLRSHIEQIPIPIAPADVMDTVVTLTDLLIEESGETEIVKLYKSLDQIIFELFGLTEEEQQIILAAVRPEETRFGALSLSKI